MTPPLIPDRACDGCTLCCKVLGIAALQSPPGVLCQHCLPGKGCGIYDRRPGECISFHCAWRMWSALGPHWFPADSHLMVILSPKERRVLIKVDPAFPDAWKRTPFYPELKLMAWKMMPDGFQIAVQTGERFVFILPDNDVDIGVIGPGEDIEVSRQMTPQGLQFGVRKIAVARQ